MSHESERAERAPLVRPLVAADTAPVLELLRARPIHNVLLCHVVRAGGLGRIPGVWGCELDGRIEGILMVGALGGACLEVRSPAAFAPLAAWVSELPEVLRHITGPEDVTEPFWREYSRRVDAPLVWQRRERVYVLERTGQEGSVSSAGPRAAVRRAREEELDAIVEHSAQQHIEDLKEDRRSLDPRGFRARHAGEIRAGHWWVLASRGRIRFQVHVGPRNDVVVQLGGVYTPPDLRGRGYATRGLRALVARLHEDRPAVSLFCDEANAVACRLYERVGFEHRFFNRSYLLQRTRGDGGYA